MVINTNLGYLDSWRGSYFLNEKKGTYESLNGTQLIPYIKSANQISIYVKWLYKKGLMEALTTWRLKSFSPSIQNFFLDLRI